MKCLVRESQRSTAESIALAVMQFGTSLIIIYSIMFFWSPFFFLILHFKYVLTHLFVNIIFVGSRKTNIFLFIEKCCIVGYRK